MEVGSVANVSEVHATSIFSLEMGRTIQVLVQYIHGDDGGAGSRSGVMETVDLEIL
jgi:hypothetical protein